MKGLAPTRRQLAAASFEQTNKIYTNAHASPGEINVTHRVPQVEISGPLTRRGAQGKVSRAPTSSGGNGELLFHFDV
jgi:hypothetical protein